MSTLNRGIPDLENYVPAAAIPIVSSTNATPIIVHAIGHGLTNYDAVWVQQHQTNVSANGVYQIFRVDADNFALITYRNRTPVVGVGVGGATGFVVPLRWSAAESLPDDGDAANASSINAPIEGALNRSAALGANMAAGAQYVYLAWNRSANNTLFTPWSTKASVLSAWTELNDVTAIFSDIDVLPADDVFLDLQFNASLPAQVAGEPGNVAFGVFVHVHEYGVAGSFASATLVPGSQIEATYSSTCRPVHVCARTSGGSLHGKQLSFFLAAYYDNTAGGPFPMFLRGGYTFKAVVMRKAF